MPDQITQPSRRRRPGRLSLLAPPAALALILAVAVAIGGCGSGDPDGGGAGADGGSGSSATPTTTATAPAAPDPGTFDATSIYAEAAPGVVTIKSLFTGAHAGPLGPSGATGSGFVLDKDGDIVTNAHVVTIGESSQRKPAAKVFVEFNDRNILRAEIVGYDPFADVALLHVDPDAVDLRPLELGNSGKLQVGEPVAAIGSPFGEIHTLTTGVVSAIGRSVRSLTDFQIEDAIQTDASINPGSSGGPLLDSEGRVIGINQQLKTNSGANEGVGYAVPISAVKRSVAQLQDTGHADYAFIGVTTQQLYPQLAGKLGIPVSDGALIADVIKGGPAQEAGLRGSDPGDTVHFQGATFEAGGDVIIAVGDHRVRTPQELGRLIGSMSPDQTVKVTYIRDKEKREAEVSLAERPDTVHGG